jgi:hypothetical protein
MSHYELHLIHNIGSSGKLITDPFYSFIVYEFDTIPEDDHYFTIKLLLRPIHGLKCVEGSVRIIYKLDDIANETREIKYSCTNDHAATVFEIKKCELYQTITLSITHIIPISVHVTL